MIAQLQAKKSQEAWRGAQAGPSCNHAPGTSSHSITFQFASHATCIAYDGPQAHVDLENSGVVKARYLYGPALDMLFARLNDQGVMAWYLTDHLGSVRDIADGSGTIIDHLQYDSFGNILSESNPASGDRFKYTGREYDAETGLYYYRARYYDPATGRFISRDPIGFAGKDWNIYRYVFNQPTAFTDPTGEVLFAPLVVWGFNVVVSAGVGGFVSWWQGGTWDDFYRGALIGAVEGAIVGLFVARMPFGSIGRVLYEGLGDGAASAVSGYLTAWINDAEHPEYAAAYSGFMGFGGSVVTRIAIGSVIRRITARSEIDAAVNASRAATVVDDAHSAAQAARLRKHLKQYEKYGEAGFRELENGRRRYYSQLKPANNLGEMQGRRKVREWDPASDTERTWFETLDYAGRTRIVRPQINGEEKVHFMYSAYGEFVGTF